MLHTQQSEVTETGMKNKHKTLLIGIHNVQTKKTILDKNQSLNSNNYHICMCVARNNTGS